MKKKLLTISFVALLLVFALCACSNEEANAPKGSDDEPTTSTQPTDLTFPVIEEDYWGLFAYNCNLIYEPCFFGSNSIDLELLSATPLEEDDVTVTTGASTEMISFVFAYDDKEGKYTMYEDVFLLYQGVTVDELTAYEAGELPIERKTEIYNLLQAFRSLDESERPMIYKYALRICFPDDVMNGKEIVDEIFVTVNGETRSYNIGTVVYKIYEKEDHAYDPNESLNCNDNVAYHGHNVIVSNDGRTLLDDVKYNAVEDVTITGLSFYKADEVKIKSVSVTETTADGSTIDTTWDTKKPIKLSGGESIILNIEIADPFFANTLGGWNIRYLMIEYQCKGNTYELPITFQCHQTLSDPFAYIAMEDGIDILSYYTDYINRNSAY